MDKSLRRSVLLVILPVLLVGVADSPAGAQRPRRQVPEYYRTFASYDEVGELTRVTFRKGLSVVIEERPSLPLVSVAGVVRVGLFDTSKTDCKVVAELVAQGLSEAVADAGGIVEFSVDSHLTSFVLTVPDEEIADALEALVEKLFHLDMENLEVVAAGVGDSQSESPQAERLKELELEAYEQVFEPELVASEDKLREFFRSYYHPKNIVLGVSGRARREQVLEKLAELVGKVSGGTEPEAGSFGEIVDRGAEPGFTYKMIRSAVDRPRVLLGYRLPGPFSADFQAIQILRYLLVEGYGSILNLPREGEEVRPFQLESRLRVTPGGTLFSLDLLPEGGLLEKAEVRVLAALKALEQFGTPTLLLNRAKALAVTDHLNSMQNLGKRAISLGYFELLGELSRRDRQVQEIASISSDDIRQVIRTYFSESRLSLLEYLPADAEERNFDRTTFLETLNILIPSELRQEGGLLEVYKDDSLAEFEPPEATSSFAESELRRSSILRGPEIYLREQHSLPLAHVGVFYAGGRAGENSSNAGITQVLLRSLAEVFLRQDNGIELLELEAMGTRIELINEFDFLGIRLSVLSPQLGPVLIRLMEWLKSPTEITEKDLSRAIATLHFKSEKICEVGPSSIDHLRRQLFGEHPYGTSRNYLCPESHPFPLSEVKAWRSRYLSKIHPYIVVTGDVAGTSFLQQMISKLSNSSYSPSRAEKNRAQPGQSSPRVALKGSNLILAFQGPRAGSDYVEMLAGAKTILVGPDGYLTSLLRDEGLAWSVDLKDEDLVQGGALYLRIQGPPERLKEAEKRVKEELGRFSEGKVDPSDFLTALVGTITHFLIRQNDPDFYLIDTMNAILAEEPTDYARRYVLNIKQLRIGEVESAIRRYMGGGQ